MMKIVNFEWCKMCKYEKDSECGDHCWGCMGEPANEDSTKPVNWEEKEK